MKIEGGSFAITGGVSMIGASIAEQLLAAGAKQVVLFDNFALSTADMVQGIIGDSRVKLVRGRHPADQRAV